MKNNKLEIYLSFCAVILSAVLLRLIPHAPNIAPIAALALFSGVAVPNGLGFAIPIIAMILSDLILGFHNTIPFVYGSFLLIALIGFLIRTKISPLKVLLGSISGSVLFFIITNFGVWITSTMYEKSASGLLKCYSMGLPFFRNTLLGDLFYTTLFFLGYRFLRLIIVLMVPSSSRREVRLGRKRHIGNTV